MFVNLHQHTTFSLLDGCAVIDNLVDKAVALEMPALAITDHGTLTGALKFYSACKAKGIKPIIGVEMYLDDNRAAKGRGYRHIILLAKNFKGYQNLLKIVSEAHVKGFYYKPRTTTAQVFKYKEGLIVSSACIHGIFHGMDGKKATQEALKWKEQFKDDFYIEIQFNELAGQHVYNEMLLTVAKRTKIEVIVTLDAHYVEPKDVNVQDFVLAVRDKKTITDPNRLKYEARNLYLMREEELWDLARTWNYDISEKKFDRLIHHTTEIADKCDLEIPFGKTHIPKMGMSITQFKNMVKRKAKAKGFHKKKRYRTRILEELRVIEKLGFHDYFLIVGDLVDWSRSNDIFVGPARGSVAGSLVSFVMDITKIDPIQHGLLFERFLNENRVDMPDIDLDFDNNKRDKVFEYIRKKYGANKVARVITFGTFGKVGAIRDLGRTYQLPLKPINEISDAIYRNGGLKEAYKSMSGLLKDFWKKNIRFIKLAEKVSHFIRSTGVHPCGTLVTPKPVYNYCPLQRVKGEIVSAFTEGEDRRELSDIGLVKLDVLGLNTCSIISDAIDIVKDTKKKDLSDKIWHLDLEDKKLIVAAQKGNTLGGFQFETESATALLRKIKPDTFAEIAALNAINRPGPLGSGAIDRFLHYEGMGIENDKMDRILKETRGVLVYQEQVMQIFNKVAGYSLVEADKLRKLAAHKLWKEGQVKKLKKNFIKRATKKLGREEARELWKILREFTKYSFNKSHATSYAYLFFQILYLKNYHPQAFFASLLSNTATGIVKDRQKGSEKNKIYEYINEARKYGIKILPPDINKSGIGFTVEGKKSIRVGLTKIKGIKEPSVPDIFEKRPFSSFSDYMTRVKGQASHKGKVVQLILAGAFDSIEDRQSAKRIYNGIKKTEVFDLNQSFVRDSIQAFNFILFHPFLEKEAKNFLLSRYCSSSQQLKNFNRWESVGVAGIVIDIKFPMGGKSAVILKIQDHRGDMFIYLDKIAEKKWEDKLKEFNILFIKGRLMGGNRIICYGERDSLVDITASIRKKIGGGKCQGRNTLI